MFGAREDQPVKSLHKLSVAGEVLAVLACYRWSGTENQIVRAQAADSYRVIAPMSRPGPSGAGAVVEDAHKFRPDGPIKTLPDLLHHIENGFPIQMPDHPDNLARKKLLTHLLDGTLPPQYQPETAWLFRGIDDRPHMSQRVNDGAEGHPSQLLADFAALGIPSAHLVRSGATSASIAELVRSLQEDFHLEGEIEWKAIALARYRRRRRAGSTAGGERSTSTRSCQPAATRARRRVVPRHSHPPGPRRHLACGRAQPDPVRIITRCHPPSSDEHDRAVAGKPANAGYWAPDWPTPHPNRGDYSQDQLLFGGSTRLGDGSPLGMARPVGRRPSSARGNSPSRHRVVRSLADSSSRRIPSPRILAYSHCLRAVTRDISPEPGPEKGASDEACLPALVPVLLARAGCRGCRDSRSISSGSPPGSIV